MFKAGEYIVTLEVSMNVFTRCARNNYCFKVYRDGDALHVEKTLDTGIKDVNVSLQFDKSRNLIDWRYATQAEINEYDRLGKPFDVTKLQNGLLYEIY